MYMYIYTRRAAEQLHSGMVLSRRLARRYLRVCTYLNEDCLPPERHLPTPGQHGHSPQRHTAAGTAAPTTADI